MCTATPVSIYSQKEIIIGAGGSNSPNSKGKKDLKMLFCIKLQMYF